MELLKPFNQLGKDDAAIAGGKGASLGEMTQAGIPVPPGFVILADAFERFIIETDLTTEIDSILGKVNHQEMHTVDHASEMIQGLILNVEMPTDLKEEIEKSFKDLNTEFVAVRSSATAEDGAEAAWAGQLDTFLNTTEETLLEKVRECWASLFTPRAIFYRFEKGMNLQKISVAVVVQKMVNSDTAGIAFSVHPVTEDHNQMIIEAGFGLGEAVVSGQVTPDSYVVTKSPRTIVDKNISEQAQGLYRKAGGGSEWKDLPKEKGSSQVITDAQILSLSEVLITIENHYGFPVDTEWAMENGELYIVQSRPITTLRASSTERSMSKKFLDAMGTDEIFKIEGDFIPLLVLIDWFNYRDQQGNIQNLYPAMCFKRDSTVNIYWSLTKYRHVSKEFFQAYLQGSLTLPEYQKTYDALKNAIDSFYTSYYVSPAKDEKDLLARLDTAHNFLREIDLVALFLDALDQKTIRETLEEQSIPVDLSSIWRISHILDTYSFHIKNKEEIIAQHTKLPASLQYVYSNYVHILSPQETITRAAAEDIDRLKKEVAENKAEASKSGERKRAEAAKLTEVEQKVLTFIDYAAELRDDRKALITKSDVMLFNLVSDLYKLWGVPQELVDVSMVMDVLKGKEHLEAMLPVLNDRLGKTAVFLTSAHEYEENDTETLDEVEAAYMRQHTPHDVTSLKGETASSGFVRGIVRIIIKQQDFDTFKEGEVLVAAMTRPEFVPLMKKAAAIVTDEGGITSHAAIVSRELGKPCVIGTRVATQILHDGDEVEVDADNGIIRILKSILSEEENKKDAFFNLGRWVAPVLEYEAWLEWCNTPESREMDIVPDSVTTYVLDGNFMLEEGGAYTQLTNTILEEFNRGEYATAQHINEVAEALANESNNAADSYGQAATLKDFFNTFPLIQRLRFPWTACFAVSDAADIYLKNYAEKNGLSVDSLSSQVPQLANPLTDDQRALFDFKQQIEKLDANYNLQDIKEIDSKLAEGIISYQQKTEYFGTHHFWGEPRTEEKLMEAIKEAVPSELQEVAGPIDLTELFSLLADTTKIRIECAESSSKLAYVFRSALTNLASTYGLAYEDIIFLTTEELQALDKKSAGEIGAIISERQKGYGLWKEGETIQVTVGTELESQLQSFGLNVDHGDVQEITGNIGCKGFVQGIVAIVLVPTDNKKVLDGMILVAPETTPDFVPAMGRAAAFVTDRGGVTSHAAIIAREMGKPCIIGTKIATQVLKDGDLVEVDANTGIVRLLSRQKGYTYSKAYTRENCLIAIQIWEEHQCHRLKEKFGVAVPLSIFDAYQGVARVYYREDIDDAWSSIVTAKAQEDRNFIPELMTWYGEQLDTLEAIWHKGTLSSAKELDELFDLASWAWVGLSISYFLPGMEGMRKEEQELGMQLRERSADFLELTDHVIQDTLRILYPALGDLVKYLRIEEVRSGDIPAIEILREREKHYIYYDFKLYTNTTIDSLLKENNFSIEEEVVPTNVSDISGQTAMTGIAKGKVRILHRKADISLLQDGEILVTAMTTPDYLPAMYKAAAFITDEGGITCHAAIVARELGKPCVIGTKIATQVLHDGDEVEVDADNGVVRILKSANTEAVLVKCFSRDHSLFYSYVWRTSNSEKGKRWIGTNIEEVLFVRPEGQEVVDVYYSENEFKLYDRAIKDKILSDAHWFATLAAYFESEWQKILPYIQKKEILTRQELSEFYDHWVNWWEPMAFMMQIPEIEGVSQEIKDQAFMLRAETQEYSDSGDKMFHAYMQNAHPELSKYFSVVTPEEVFGDTFPSESILEARLGGWYMTNTHFGLIGELPKALKERYFVLEVTPVNDTTELKGQSAYKGIVRGTVRVLARHDQISEVQKGEILVTAMTTPDFFPALEKASAFITDEGGITCHAAIVAREMQKPCIIGTKFATQILKDGDEVEVDADNGVVRILKTAASERIEFIKEYTRDTTLIIQQAWSVVLKKHRSELGLHEYDNQTLVLHYLHDGVIEVWENHNWTPALMNEILKRNTESDTTFNDHIEKFLKGITFLKPYWEQGFVSDAAELSSIVDHVFETMYHFDWMYYPALDDRTPLPIRNRARELRDQDIFFDQTDRFIRKSLLAIYPNLQGYEQCILRDEITAPPSLEILRTRKQHFIAMGDDASYTGTIEEYQKEHPEMHFAVDAAPIQTATLTGQIGNKGYAKGIVRIMKRKEQIPDAQEGDIIVSTMTTPDFIPAMQKAAAIVTDEGGITCHAAIVAREMNKPCVIGTKFATQLLKDGDFVEVDADNGVVRKIDRISFKKSYSRDTTLFMQELWAKGLIELPEAKFGWKNPYLPLVAHYVNDGVVEIWEHQEAISWLLDRLLQENKKGSAFLEGIFKEYKALLKKLKKFHNKESLSTKEAEEYVDLIYDAAFAMTLFFYTGSDERSPKDALEISVKAREIEDFFAGNDVFVRKIITNTAHISEELAGVVLAEELSANAIPSSETLQNRLKNYLLIDGMERWTSSLKDFSIAFPEYIFLETEVEATTELRGQSAYNGVVQGSVRIVRKQSDMAKVLEGNILVSPMTTPDFLPAMLRAAAFVTDEGGITCHAAIVAREMKKPCVIGTKIATQILKDGDEVEVDAINGIVRILKSNSVVRSLSKEDIVIGDWEFEAQQRGEQPIFLCDLFSRALVGMIHEMTGKNEYYDYLFTDSDKLNHSPKHRDIVLNKTREDMLDPAKRKEFLRGSIEIPMSFNAVADEINEKVNDSVSNKELARLWRNMDRDFLKVIPWFYYPWYVSKENMLTDFVKAGLEKHRTEIEKVCDMDEALLAIVFPIKKTNFQLEQDEMLGLVTIAEENSDFTNDAVFKQHAAEYLKKYDYLTTFILSPILPMTYEQLVERVSQNVKESFKDNYEIQKEATLKNQERAEQILKIVSDDNEIMPWIEDSRELGYVLTAGIEEAYMASARYLPFIQFVAKRIGVTFEDTKYLLSNEIATALEEDKKIPAELIDERRDGFVLMMKDGVQYTLFGKKGHELSAWIDSELNKVDASITEFTGQRACKGFAKGKVRIATTPAQAHLLQEGEILVCPMTNPDYVPAMRRSAAIVTDEGGLLCHAAIMSREFNKPCIIGTKIATQLLKDGDMVEVDADKGIVRKL
ncbi:MAG: PEP-utilizing enzyme mobile domain protein [Parcubacteria group bacterium]|nr:PEP-utilizing enzyme mobile domain protein [Parcubacteria group bacterium]